MSSAVRSWPARAAGGITDWACGWLATAGFWVRHAGAGGADRTRRAGRWLGDSIGTWGFDRWDWTCVIGLLTFGAGLWRWFSLGVALTVAGGLVLALGVAGACGEELAELVRRQLEQRRQRGG